jgi:BirA family biotin operon repressor/biotin-[acetyl-CoA-carboxylase] ligase
MTEAGAGSHSILQLRQVDSTNRYALANLRDLSDRQVIIADRQTGGYGRLGRSWMSRIPDNLFMSIVLKPHHARDMSSLPGITQYMSITLCTILSSHGLEPGIKWPNDVLVNERKIAGILGEGSFRGDAFMGYVLGTGVNLNMRPEDLDSIDQPATALNLLLGHAVDRDGFLNELLERFFFELSDFLREGFPRILKRYSERSTVLGREIVVTSQAGRCTGKARRFDETGALIVETGEGAVRLCEGDVRSLRLN